MASPSGWAFAGQGMARGRSGLPSWHGTVAFTQGALILLHPNAAPPRCGLHSARSVLLLNDKGHVMKRATVIAGVLFAFALPLTAQAQGVPGGAAHGFHEGNRIAGPVGAVVGTAVGGVIGGVEGVLGVNHRHAAYSNELDTPPPRSYRQRKAKRVKAKHARRVHS